MLKRYIVELGMGADIHGGDITKAAIRAVRDATSKSCLSGIVEILKKSPQDMHVNVKIGCTNPEKVDKNAVLKAVPIGEKDIEVVQGGLGACGLEVPMFGGGNTIEVVVAALTVTIDL